MKKIKTTPGIHANHFRHLTESFLLSVQIILVIRKIWHQKKRPKIRRFGALSGCREQGFKQVENMLTESL
jgi:hypothetical protein